ncbi:MAG: hypothetical protein RLZZ15_1831 [Verrucomicrobiota bacterium]
MNETVPAPAADSDACAVLVLDAAGRVTAANSSAASLWNFPPADLVGAPFAALFAFDIVSADPEFLDAQWEGLLLTALEKPSRLTAQPRDAAPREVRVRLEPFAGGAPGYLATVEPSRPAAAQPSAAPDDRAAALQLLADHGGAAFFDLQLAAGAVLLSPAWKKLLGYADAELPSTLDAWRSLLHPDDTAASPDHAGKKTAPGARAFNVEFRMRHRRGHWVWVQSLGVQFVGAAGELQRVVGLHLDISERKLVEEESAANDARLQDLAGAGPLAAFELDFAGKIFWFSPAFEKLLGHDEGALPPTAAAFAAALPPDEASVGVEAWLLARAPGRSAFVEAVSLHDRAGRAVRVLLGAVRTLTRKRDLARVVGFACPLPADLAAATGDGDSALPPALARETFDLLAEAVLVADARGKILFANAPAARLLRTAPDALLGQAVGDVFRLVHRATGRPADDPIDSALTADQPLPLFADTALAPAEDGASPTPIIWTARASFGSDAKPRGVAIVFRDPGELTLTPDELVRANRFESLALKAGGIAHDFNNLLSTILAAVTLATDRGDASALPDAAKSCDTAKSLTKQLLTFAKGGTGTRTVCVAREILVDSIRIATAASSVAPELTVPDGVDPVEVDRPQILQVFQNLIVNALQAMPPPPHAPRLQLRARNVALADDQLPGLAAGDYVEFEVRDNGSGIPPEHVEKIFDPFFTTKKHGTGLGLATVHSVVRRHGGQIGLDTEVGVGTAFTVYLPKAGRAVEAQARRAPSLNYHARTNRVLLMDDDVILAGLTAKMLVELGYTVDLTARGEDAFAKYSGYFKNKIRHYDVVILDLTVVGGMGGEECFKKLKALDPEVRAIVSTGYDNDEMNQAYFDMGFLGYLTKPYRTEQLGKVLKTVLG